MLDLVTSIALRAGDALMPYWGNLIAADGRHKGGRRNDPVSDADLAAERVILAALPPGDAVLAEESGERPGGGRQWLVDPLDGTVNFLHGIPFWSVSIALVHDRELEVGVVHAPALGMTFTAAAGAGASLNGTPIRVSPVTDLREAIVATGFPYDRARLKDSNLDNIPRVGPAVGGIRRLGSAALDLALVAAGRLDAFWELHLNPWDLAAGVLLVREAGGRVTDCRGVEDTSTVLGGRNVVASNGPLHEPLRGLLAPLREL